MGRWIARRAGKDNDHNNPSVEDRRAASRFVPWDSDSPTSKLIMVSLDNRELQRAYGTILNLSEVGACVVSDRFFDVGRQVCLGIGHHPYPSYFMADGEVVWHRGGFPLDGNQDGFLHGVRLATLPESQRIKLEQKRRISQKVSAYQLAEQKQSRRYRIAILGVCVPLIFCIGGTDRWSSVAEERVRTSATHFEKKTHWLETTMNFEAKQQHLVQAIQDEILRTNPDLDPDDAYRYAQLLQESSNKYPSIDPILFLSIGIIESRYNPFATSHANAKGLYQIWPATGRLLAQELDWSYSDDMLYDPEKNTALAALYLDMLHSIHKGDIEMVLAEYNGGTRNARLYRQRSSRIAAETSQYVIRGRDVYSRLSNSLGLDTATQRWNSDPYLTED